MTAHATDVVVGLGSARKAVQLYPPAHPAFSEAMDALISAVDGATAEGPFQLNLHLGRLYDGSLVIPEDIHGILDHGEAVQVGVHDDVGDVAVHEELAGQQADDLVGRHAAVGTADPEVARSLLFGQGLEERGVAATDAFGPLAVLTEQVFDGGHRRHLHWG